MKTIQLIILLISITIISTSCSKSKLIRASGNVTEVEKTVSNFDEIEVSHAFEVEVNYSATEERVVVEADDNIQEHIAVETVGNRLVIRLANQLSIRGKETMKVHITTANLHTFEVSGASEIQLNNPLVTTDANIKLSGASQFEGAIDAANANIYLSGASQTELTGSLNNLEITGSGASTLESYNLQTNSLSTDLSGASQVELTVNGTLNVNASGASQIKYKGTGVVASQDLSGASTITKID